MSDRLLICPRCSAVIQRGSGPSCPDLCDGCRENDRKDAGNELEVLSLAAYPAGLCSCGKWAYTETHQHGDTEESKRHAMITDHRRHVDEVL